MDALYALLEKNVKEKLNWNCNLLQRVVSCPKGKQQMEITSRHKQLEQVHEGQRFQNGDHRDH